MKPRSYAFLLVLLFLSFSSIGENRCVETDKKNCVLEKSRSKIKPRKRFQHQSILGAPLELCSKDPVTGWFRDGYCKSNSSDRGNHSVCAEVTDEFLIYSRSQGNDLITPNRRYGFPGLKGGDRWCLCAARVLEAKRAGVKLKVIKEATHPRSLEVIDLR